MAVEFKVLTKKLGTICSEELFLLSFCKLRPRSDIGEHCEFFSLSLIRAVSASQQVTIRDNSACHLVVRVMPPSQNMGNRTSLSCSDSLSWLTPNKLIYIEQGTQIFP